MSMLANAPTRLNIPCHSGTPQAIHPCVIDFQTEYGMKWGGYRYWMAFTPYPDGNDAHEDPNIVASHDGQTWVVPAGFINPIDDQPGQTYNSTTQQYDGSYNADTTMVYDPLNDRLCVYWITTARGGVNTWGMNHTTVFRLAYVYDDGTHTTVGGEYGYLFATTRSQVPNANVEPTFPAGSYLDAVSPAVWRESATKWHMWHIGTYLDGDGQRGIIYRFSADGVTWGDPQPCTPQDPIRGYFTGYSVWHIQCKHNQLEGRVEFIVAGKIGGESLAAFYFECPDDSPTTLVTPEAFQTEPLIEASVGGWDSGQIYTTAFTVQRDGAAYSYEVWYSGRGTSEWGTGYATAVLPTSVTTHDFDILLTADTPAWDFDVLLTKDTLNRRRQHLTIGGV